MLKKIFKLTTKEIKDLFKQKDTPFKLIRSIFFDVKIFSKFNKIENFIDLTNIQTKSAVIISSKIFKKAVDRNKIRRQFYSLIENYIKDKNKTNTNLNKQIFLFFYPKKELKNIKFQNLEKEVYNTLDKII